MSFQINEALKCMIFSRPPKAHVGPQKPPSAPRWCRPGASASFSDPVCHCTIEERYREMIFSNQVLVLFLVKKSIFSLNQGQGGIFTLRKCVQSIFRMILPLYRLFWQKIQRLVPNSYPPLKGRCALVHFFKNRFSCQESDLNCHSGNIIICNRKYNL